MTNILVFKKGRRRERDRITLQNIVVYGRAVAMKMY